jgi:hypothetical protein
MKKHLEDEPSTQIERYTETDAEIVYRNPITPTHPLYRRFDVVARNLNPESAAPAAELIQSAPRGGGDVEANARFLNKGNAVALVLNRANQDGVERGTRAVIAGRESFAAASDRLTDARNALDERQALGDQIVPVCGYRYTRAALPVAMDSARAAAARLDARGETTYRQKRSPGVWGYLLSGAIALLDTVAVYLPVFNPGDPLGVLQLCVFGGLAFVSAHFGTRWIGSEIRRRREATVATGDAQDQGVAFIQLGFEITAPVAPADTEKEI